MYPNTFLLKVYIFLLGKYENIHHLISRVTRWQIQHPQFQVSYIVFFRSRVSCSFKFYRNSSTSIIKNKLSM